MKIRWMTLILVASFPLAALAKPAEDWQGPPPPPPMGGCDCRAPAAVVQLQHEIAAIKLDRLLDLTPAQAKALLPIVQEAQKNKQKLKDEQQRRSPALIEAMTAARDELKQTGEVSQETAKKLREARGGFKFKQVREEVESMQAQIGAILTEAQKQSFETFDPRPLASASKGVAPWDDGDDRRPPPPHEGCPLRRGKAAHGGAVEGCPMQQAIASSEPGTEGERPEGCPAKHHKGKRGHGPKGKRDLSMMMLSDEFLPLLQARAR